MIGVSAAGRSRRRARNLLIGLQIALLVFGLVAPAIAVAATIQTDLWVYQNGDTVTVTGVEYGASENVVVVSTDPAGTEVDRGSATTDGNGSFTYEFVLNVTIPGIYDVVATGQTSGLTASTQFDPPAPTVAPTSVAFGSQAVGTQSAPTTITISNGTGATNLNIQSVTSSSAEFPVDLTGMVNSVSGGSSTTFKARFAPTSSGAKSATITIKTNASGPDLTVSVSGTGTTTNRSPDALDDIMTVGEDSGTTSIDVRGNDSDPDSDPLTVSAVGPAGHGTTGFSSTTATYAPAANYCGPY
jgi:hypothetical protein